MSTDTATTDRTFIVLVTALVNDGGHKAYEVEARDAAEAAREARLMAVADTSANYCNTYTTSVQLKDDPELVCGSCGEPQGSNYAGYCCSLDNMIEA